MGSKEQHDISAAKSRPKKSTYRAHLVKSLVAKADAERTQSEKIADWITAKFGSIWFLLINVLWFIIWIAVNLGVIPGIPPFDEFPFGLLTMIVSLEAIILAIFVLISQNRGEKIATLRQEIDLQVNIRTEEEITKLLDMIRVLLEKQGVDTSQDTILQSMLEPTNTDKIQKDIEQQMLR
jgi:uncharacterized membrane protein